MNSVLKKNLVLILLLFSTYIYSQEKKDSIPLSERYIVFEGDTLLIELEEVKLLKKLNFKTSYDRRYYYWYRKKTLKAYPYAKLAADRLEVISKRMSEIKSRRKRKKYTKRVQKYIEGEFTSQLKKLTRTEGRILIKLIHRQTGETAFDLVKDLRSGWRAFWYNTTAIMFKLSLKDKFDPKNNYKDFLVEDILQRAFLNGELEEQLAKIDFDYLLLSSKYLIAPQKEQKNKK